jgi:hypothetical protein
MHLSTFVHVGLVSASLCALSPAALAQRQSPSTISTGGSTQVPDTERASKFASLQLGPNTFRRIATFPVFQNTDADQEAVAEIVAAANDGTTLIYTDSAQELLGFVDITDPTTPTADGTIDVGGEPTSVATVKKLTFSGTKEFALVCVNTSDGDFVNPSGLLHVIDVDSRTIVRTIDLGGQPDAIAVAPFGQYACIAIENERDEDLGDGAPPQAPAGFLVIVDLVLTPEFWSTRTVGLDGVADLFPNDAEPEFVDINLFDVAVVTLQENNHIVLVDLPTGAILNDFSAGTADLEDIDTNENDLIEQVDALAAVPREPDGVAWISQIAFATADEGDLDGGSRGFTNWSVLGLPTYGAGNSLDHLAARVGHYPEDRSENKGVEPEGAEFGWFGPRRFLFVGAERANLVYVYEIVAGPIIGQFIPLLRQVLPTGVAPEGLLAIGERDLFVVACEADDRGDGIRSTLMIYERSTEPNYPTLASVDRAGTGVPIPWGALTGLAAEPLDPNTVYAVHDDTYQRSRVLAIDRSGPLAKIVDEVELRDPKGQLWVQLWLTGAIFGNDAPDFSIDAIINADKSVNLDLEGITLDANGDFWMVTEGRGETVGGVSVDGEEFELPNFIVHATRDGVIQQVYRLPFPVDDDQGPDGFTGLAVVGRFVYVAFQRAWEADGDPAEFTRIGRFDTTANDWKFAYYPLDLPASPDSGKIGLSELVHMGGDDFAVIERDSGVGPDASTKRVMGFSIAGVNWLSYHSVPNLTVLDKHLVKDLVVDGVWAPWAGLVPGQVDGMTLLQGGAALIVNDNQGVDDNNGETLLVEIDLPASCAR